MEYRANKLWLTRPELRKLVATISGHCNFGIHTSKLGNQYYDYETARLFDGYSGSGIYIAYKHIKVSLIIEQLQRIPSDIKIYSENR